MTDSPGTTTGKVPAEGVKAVVMQASQGTEQFQTMESESKGTLEDLLLESAVRTLRDAEAWIADLYGGKLTGLNMKCTREGWFAVVKATHGKRRLVAFETAGTLADLIAVVGYKLGRKELSWTPDKY